MFHLLSKLHTAIYKGSPNRELLYHIKRDRDIDKWEEKKGLVKAVLKKPRLYSIYIRKRPSSDYKVYRQVFKNKEYAIVIDVYNQNFKTADSLNIVDAGSNVGYTSLFFSLHLNVKKIIAIEPDKENFKMLEINVQAFRKIKPLWAALTSDIGSKFIIDDQYRDGLDWSKTTTASKKGDISGITMAEIINNENLNFIDILKIDIEGSERFLFKEGVDKDFLKITKVIAIEIHDEWNIRSHIYLILKTYGFVIFNYGELTLGINTSLLSHES